MKENYQGVKGFRDILPDESRIFWVAEKRARELFERFGYQEIILPILEYEKLFSRSIGESTDIVEKEMFSFVPKTTEKEMKLSLRPEATAPVVRSYIENNLKARGLSKLFYIGPMFRYERPQKGRYRQFWQIGVEAFGYPGPGIDAEILLMANDYFKSFQLKGIELKLNSLGCRNCRPEYKSRLIDYFKKNKESICENCKKRLLRNPLRVLDCKEPDCKKLSKNAPSSSEFLCTLCKDHFDKLCGILDSFGLSYEIDKHLVRGLDYYTRTVFEFQETLFLGAQNTVCAGGRYDNLVEELGGEPTPAIGFAIGVDRLAIILSAEKKIPSYRPDLYLAFLGERAYKYCLFFAKELRRKGFVLEMDPELGTRSLKSLLREADRIKARFCLIVGDNEIEAEKAILRNMETGEQNHIGFKTIFEELKKYL